MFATRKQSPSPASLSKNSQNRLALRRGGVSQCIGDLPAFGDGPVPCELLPELSLPEKLLLTSRVPFTRSCHSLDMDSLPGSVDLDISSDPLPFKTTQTGRVVYDPDAAV